ncbi:MAG: prepilin-type N-terminal cleavage/methylation domain-containing protein, partial [Sneathiella sp.]
MVKTRTLRQTKKADSAGFTLLELLVVLTIVALSAYLIAPHFQGRKGKSDIVFLTAEMQSQLSLARSISISKNKPVTFSLDVKSRSFNIDGNLPTAISENIDIELLVGTSSEQYTDIGKITFYPDG